MKWFLFLLLGIVAGLWFACKTDIFSQQHRQPAVTMVHDTVRVCDTVRIPVIVERMTVRVDTVTVAAVEPTDGTGDSVTVALPIERSVYEGDGWRAWVSGFRANLDSVAVERRTVTSIREVTKWRERRWCVSAGVGISVDRHGRVEPGLYAGVGYRFFSF